MTTLLRLLADAGYRVAREDGREATGADATAVGALAKAWAADQNVVPAWPCFELVDVTVALSTNVLRGGIIARHTKLEHAEEAAQAMLREDGDLWLSIVEVDAAGLAETVVAQVEVQS